MKFEDIHHVYYALKSSNQGKKAFLHYIKEMPIKTAEEIAYHKFNPREHSLLIQAKKKGISTRLVKEAARWKIYENTWSNFNFTRM